jgi:hypothetical protein
MSHTGKSAAARAKGAVTTTSTKAATAATCVEAATSAVPPEPSWLGTPYRYGNRKEGKRCNRSNAQIFFHRTLPVHFLSPSIRIVAAKIFPRISRPPLDEFKGQQRNPWCVPWY